MLKILVVDDAREDLLLAERVFWQCHILNPIHLMNNGDECIKLFEAATPEQDPYLVFLDLAMPTSGLNILATLREKRLLRDSVLVVLSGSTDVKEIHQSYQLGARSFLTKPFNGEDFLELLTSLATRIHVEQTASGQVLHWVSTPEEKRSSDTEFIRRPGAISMRA